LEDANRYATAHQDVKGLAQTCFVQGISYKNIRNYDKAVECFEEAKSLYKSLNLISFFTMAQMIMAYSVTAEKNPLLALQQLEDCAASFRHENDHKQLTQALAKMAGVYLQLHQDEKALACLKQAEECVRVHAMQRDPETGELYRTFSSYFFKQRDYRQAIEYGLRSAELFEGIGLIGDQVDSLQVVADAFREMGDLGQAWHYERMCVQRLKQLQEGSMVL
jgi:tetratricopeptide (TPR) repeat protein